MVRQHHPGRAKPRLLGSLVQFAANIFIFIEQPQPERLPVCNVRTTQHCLIDPLITIIESDFERSTAGIEVRARARRGPVLNRMKWMRHRTPPADLYSL
jgi:hypothetical protein